MSESLAVQLITYGNLFVGAGLGWLGRSLWEAARSRPAFDTKQLDELVQEVADGSSEYQRSLVGLSALVTKCLAEGTIQEPQVRSSLQTHRHVSEFYGRVADGWIREAERFAAAGHDDLSNVKESLSEERSQVSRLGERLADVESGKETPEALLDDVQVLQATNVELQSELRSARERIRTLSEGLLAAEKQANVDSLTDVATRRAFDERLVEEFDRLQRTGQPFSLVMLDVDGFKAVNDEHGHVAGDAVLAVLGRTLKSAKRSYDFVARYGGEEFTLLLRDTAHGDAARIAERIRQRVDRATVIHDGSSIQFTASFGVAEAQPDETPQQLIARCDQAMYAAKVAGRNQTFVHREDECLPAVPRPKPAESRQTEREPATAGAR